MGQTDRSIGKGGLSRRDFLKVTAAGAAAGSAGLLDWSVATPAFASLGLTEGVDYDTFHTTCPYCSAQCGQIVVIAKQAIAAAPGRPAYAAGDYIDIYGDPGSPTNNGGLCAKGAGSYQLATNNRRLGVTDNVDGMTGTAWKRTGNGAWGELSVDTAMSEIAGRLKTARDSDTTNFAPASGLYNSDGVMFFGCSHANNEVNNMYRKLIANVGTSNTEHQARI